MESKTIAINGTRLDQVPMPMEPYGDGVELSFYYPKNQVRFARDDRGLHLVMPTFLAVELYRTGVLPQDVSIPVTIAIGGRPVGKHLISDVRYPNTISKAHEVNFTLTRVRQRSPRTSTKPVPPPVARVKKGIYVTDITHYLDEDGEIAPPSGPARTLASFLVLLIEAATDPGAADSLNTGIRCRAKDCQGIVRTLLPKGGDEISWLCPTCGQNGVIRNWQNTKWNQLERTGAS